MLAVRAADHEARYNACLQLTFIDWAVVALYFLFNLGIGLYYKSRAGKSMDEFFLSGRNIPWWLAGTSMVATTLAVAAPACAQVPECEPLGETNKVRPVALG